MTREQEYISAFRRPNLLHGVIVRTDVHSGTIGVVYVPPLPKDVVIISAKHLPGSNSVKILDVSLPLLAGEKVRYKGQPVLAVFAPTSEAAAAAASQIKIRYLTPEPNLRAGKEEGSRQPGPTAPAAARPPEQSDQPGKPAESAPGQADSSDTSGSVSCQTELPGSSPAVNSGNPEPVDPDSAQDLAETSDDNGGLSDPSGTSSSSRSLPEHIGLKAASASAAPPAPSEAVGSESDRLPADAIPVSTDSLPVSPAEYSEASIDSDARTGGSISGSGESGADGSVSTVPEAIAPGSEAEVLESTAEAPAEKAISPDSAALRPAPDIPAPPAGTTSVTPPARTPSPAGTEYLSKTFTWGNFDKLFGEAASIIEQTYMTGTQTSETTAPIGALAEFSDDKLTIHAATQWPFHVRNVVSDVCGIPKRKVTVIQTGYHPTQDEKLIYPSIYGAICAAAAMKTGLPARIIDPEPSYRPEMVISRRTALSPDRIPTAEAVDIQINVGAYALFAEEMVLQVVAGAAPIYDIEGVQITVRLVTTPTPPRHHFKGLGFNNAVYSAEAHASHLALQTQSNPLSWRIKYLKVSRTRPSEQVRIRTQLLKELLENTAARSDFNRKHAVYELQKRKPHNISPFYRYARGIGIACGYGITGFSRSFSEEKKHAVLVSLGQNEAVTVALSIVEPEAENIWKTIISEILGVDRSKISIQYGSTAQVPDTGPDLLRREIHHISGLIARCCDSIKSQRFKEPLPIRVKRGFKQPAPGETRTQLFTGLNWGAVVVELEVDTISLETLVKGIWGTFESGRVFHPDRVAAAIAKSLHHAGIQCGGTDRPGIMQPNIDIRLVDSEATLPTSVTETSYGLIAAAFAGALSQALNTPVHALPTSADNVLKILSRGGRA